MSNISYIIPTYNSLNLLKRCLLSLISQIDIEDKIIIIDDGSQDDTLDYLKTHYSKNKEILILSQKNLGSGEARNYGIRECQTDYIWFIDADDMIEKNSVSKIKKVLKENKYDLVYFDFIFIDSKEEKHFYKLDINPNDKKTLYLTLHSPWNKIIKTSIFSDIKFPNEKIRFQDHATIPKVIYKAKSVYYLKEYLYYYDFSNVNNISKNLKKENDIYTACDYLVNFFLEKKAYEELELLTIKTLIYDKMFKVIQQEIPFYEKYKELKKINKYLNSNVSGWKKSKWIKFQFVKKYIIGINYYKIIIIKLFRVSPFLTQTIIYPFLKIRNIIN